MITRFFRALWIRGVASPRPSREAPRVKGAKPTDMAVDVAPPDMWRV